MKLDKLQNQLHTFSKELDKDFKSHVRASVTIVFAIENNQLFLLFMKRKENENDPWSGHYSFPGGKLGEKEGFLEAAKRECKEEVGLSLNDKHLVGHCDDYFFSHSSNLVIRPFVYILDKKVELINCKHEVDQSFWWPLSGILEESSFEKRSFDTFIGEMTRPCLVYQNHIIWGITLTIFNNLLTKWQGQEVFGELLSPYDLLP